MKIEHKAGQLVRKSRNLKVVVFSLAWLFWEGKMKTTGFLPVSISIYFEQILFLDSHRQNGLEKCREESGE